MSDDAMFALGALTGAVVLSLVLVVLTGGSCG
jgi:hypothetical protein